MFKTKHFRQKTKETLLNNYGYEYITQVPEIKEKFINTMLKNDCFGFKSYFFDNIYFDSSWEVAFYIYHIDKGHTIIHEPKYFEYYVLGEIHYYFPDFKVNNLYYEIKGEQFILRDKKGNVKTFKSPYKTEPDIKYIEKYKCLKKHNVHLITIKEINKYLNYITNNYGSNYLEQFRI